MKPNADIKRGLESGGLPRIVVAEIAAIPLGVSLSLLSHHLVAIAVIAISVLAVLPFVAVAIRQRQGRRLVGIGTCNSDNWSQFEKYEAPAFFFSAYVQLTSS